MNTIFLPLLIQVGMTFTILIFVPLRRIKAIKADPSLLVRAATDSSGYPEDCKKVANSFANQFQLPVLFYIGCILALLVGATGPLAGAFAWTFVGLRIIHAFIHCGYNKVRHRFYAFGTGFLVLVGFWIVVAMTAKDSPLFTGAHSLTGLAG